MRRTLEIAVPAAATEVPRRVRTAVPNVRQLSVVTSEATSFIAPAHHEAIGSDRDEAIWEEMESGPRHQDRIGVNYLLLLALGGIICAVGLVGEPVLRAVAFIASAIIAPGFDPTTKLPPALVLRRGPLFWLGLRSSLVGYLVLILTAGLTFGGLVVGRPGLAWDGLARFDLDWLFVLAAGLVVFGLKQARVHRCQLLM